MTNSPLPEPMTMSSVSEYETDFFVIGSGCPYIPVQVHSPRLTSLAPQPRDQCKLFNYKINYVNYNYFKLINFS